VNFPFICSNILAAPALYGIYIISVATIFYSSWFISLIERCC